jgi:alkaline phosphatase D
MRFTASAMALAAVAATPALADNHAKVHAKNHSGHSVPMSAEELLAPYYTKLRQSVQLPVAAPNVSVPQGERIDRIAFGSCNHQLRHQDMWGTIAATDPNLFLFIGDNNYGDQGWAGDASLGTLREAYRVMATSPELTAFRSKVPMMVTWDDHDFGFNDGGGSFAYRGWSETIFETFWGSSPEVRSRPGVYESVMLGERGKQVQVITLDTRFFRSDFERMPYQKERPPLGPYVPSNDASKTMLGGAQWAWLAQELAKPADVRILASSIQVITDAHNYESWEALPLERAKLYEMLSKREESGLVLLSGDRHAGGIYYDQQEGDDFWELTSSSMNYSFSSTERNTAREPDPKRLTDFISEENFGLVDINWTRREITMELRGNQGESRVKETFAF